MKSIDKLREWSCRTDLHEIADEIEAEIAERYMKRPVDADGEPIRMGDIVEGELFLDNATVKGTVTTYHIHDNDEPDTVYIKVDCGSGTWTIKELRIERCRHVKPRTLEDVLNEFGIAAARELNADPDGYGISDKTIAKCVSEIRELLGGDAE